MLDSSASPRLLQILEKAIREAEKAPDLGPEDPSVIDLKRLLARLRGEPSISPRIMLLVENSPKDAAIAVEVARSLDLNLIHAYTTASQAQFHLEKGMTGQSALPDIIVLDLDLEQESGYELLRFWRITKELSDIPMLVWSGLGDHHQEICDVFKVDGFVGKWEGKDALKQGILACLGRKIGA